MPRRCIHRPRPPPVCVGRSLVVQRRACPPFVPPRVGEGDTQHYDLFPDTEEVDDPEKPDKWSNVKRTSPSRASIFNPSDFTVF